MPIRLVVTDLDNTLWDWFHVWYVSFSAMLDELVRETGLQHEVLEDEIRAVHQRARTAEYTFVLDETPSLVRLAAPHLPSQAFKGALEARARARRRETRLYPGVLETLQELDGRGIPVVAFTESNAYWTEWRIRRTGIDGLLRVLYSAPDHAFPDTLVRSELRSYGRDHYGLKKTQHRTTPADYLKPDPAILRSILGDFNAEPGSVLYVGDSLMKDVAMANQVGAISALAKYGSPIHKREYDLLRRVTHWSDEDVERERIIAESNPPVPAHVFTRGYWELIDVVTT